MPPALRAAFLVLLAVAAVSCSHSSPQLVQVFSQVTRSYSPDEGAWSDRLSVFVQAQNADGTRLFDRLHVWHDDSDLGFSWTRATWTQVERPGEFWVGANGLAFPGGAVPRGTWKLELVTRSGQKVLTTFAVPPAAGTLPPPRGGPVTLTRLKASEPRFRVAGWVEQYLVWPRDSGGRLLGRQKTVGPDFTVPAATAAFSLYSYDKVRGEGLEAGPFPVEAAPVSADR